MATVDAAITEAAAASDESVTLHALAPIADTDAGEYTSSGGGSLYAAIDEAVASASDFIKSPDDPQSDAVEFRHAPASANGAPRVIAYEAKTTGGGQIDVTIELWCDQTLIATFTDTHVASISKYYHQLTPAQRAAITDKTLLYTKVIANRVGQTISASITEAASAQDDLNIVTTGPSWDVMQDLAFTQGTPEDKSIASYVHSDDPCLFDLASGDLLFPPINGAITFIPETATFSYDGTAVGAEIDDPVIVSGVSVGADDQPWAEDWNTRSTRSSVVRRWDFGTDGIGTNTTATTYPPTGADPTYGAVTSAEPILDTTVKPSDAGGSLRFDIYEHLWPDGLFTLWLSENSATEFGENSHFFLQWRQRWNTAFIETYLLDNADDGSPQRGIKQLILDSSRWTGSHSGTHLVPTSYEQCRFTDVEIGDNNYVTRYNNGSDHDLQPGGDNASMCWRSSHFADPYETQLGGCINWYANEWMTFQIEVILGSITTKTIYNDGNLVGTFPVFADSVIRFWQAREGQASVKTIDWNPLTPGYSEIQCDPDYPTFGKIFLLPYMTAKSMTQDHPLLQTWYSSIIVATEKIPDPL